jgi:zinc protease
MRYFHINLLVVFAIFFVLLTSEANALEIQKTETNGKEIWFSQNSQNPIISIKIAFKNSGSAYDEPTKIGLANFVTAMLNEGAGDIKSEEFLELLEDNSIGFSAGIDADNFYVSIKTLTSNLPLTLKLLNLAITTPNFEPQDVARIKQQLLTGLRKKQENANEIAGDAFKQKFFGEHEYAKISDGTIETISKISSQDLHKFVQQNFTAENFVIGISGDVDEKLAQETTQKILANLPQKNTQNSQNSIADFVNFPPTQDVFVAKNFPQTVIYFAKQGVDRHDESFYAAYLLNHTFGGGSFQSRLYEQVREKRGLSYYSWSGLQSYENANLLTGSIATQTDKKDEAIAVIKDEMQKLAENGVTEAELKSARKYVIGAYPFSLDSSSAIVAHIVDMQLDALPIDYANQRKDYFEKVSLQQVNDLAKTLFAKQGWFFISVGK